MTSNAVALVATADALAPLSQASREAAVTAYLTTARDQLDLALGAESVAAIKAEITTAADATKRLGLSKEIQADAQEMVRRAEYTLGKAIRKGQEAGEIASKGERLNRGRPDEKTSPAAFFTGGGEEHMVSVMASTPDEQFEDVLEEARDEGNLSRANVVRKIKGQQGPQTRDERADLAAKWAAQGHSRDQVATKLGIGREAINNIAKDYAIDFPADVAGRARRIDPDRVTRETVHALEGLVMILPRVNVADLDPREAQKWTASLDLSIRALNRFNKKIRETIQ